jgi:hypothetical protein
MQTLRGHPQSAKRPCFRPGLLNPPSAIINPQCPRPGSVLSLITYRVSLITLLLPSPPASAIIVVRGAPLMKLRRIDGRVLWVGQTRRGGKDWYRAGGRGRRKRTRRDTKLVTVPNGGSLSGCCAGKRHSRLRNAGLNVTSRP